MLLIDSDEYLRYRLWDHYFPLYFVSGHGVQTGQAVVACGGSHDGVDQLVGVLRHGSCDSLYDSLVTAYL